MSGWVGCNVHEAEHDVSPGACPEGLGRVNGPHLGRLPHHPCVDDGLVPCAHISINHIRSVRGQGHVRRVWQLGSPEVLSHANLWCVCVVPVEMVVEWCRMRTDAMNSRTGRGWSSPPTSTMPLRKKFLHTKHGRHRGQQSRHAEMEGRSRRADVPLEREAAVERADSERDALTDLHSIPTNSSTSQDCPEQIQYRHIHREA